MKNLSVFWVLIAIVLFFIAIYPCAMLFLTCCNNCLNLKRIKDIYICIIFKNMTYLKCWWCCASSRYECLFSKMEYESDITDSIYLLKKMLDKQSFSNRTDFKSLKKVINLIHEEKQVFGLIMICRQALKIPCLNSSKWKKENIEQGWQVIEDLTKRLKCDDKDEAKNMTLFEETYTHVVNEANVSSEKLKMYLSYIVKQNPINDIEEANPDFVNIRSLEDSLLKIPKRKYSMSKREVKKKEYYLNKEQCVIF